MLCFSDMSVKARMDKLIKDYAVFVVSKSYCPFCKTAKNVLAQYDIPPEKMKIIDIEGDKDCSEIQNYKFTKFSSLDAKISPSVHHVSSHNF